VLFLLVLGIWGVSFWRTDNVYRQTPAGGWSVSSAPGWVVIRTSAIRVIGGDGGGIAWSTSPVLAGRWRIGRYWNVAGRWELRTWGFGPAGVWHGPQWRVVAVQCWLPAWVFAIAPSAWLGRRVRRWRQRRAILAGRCAGCGYDVRATPARCPECGLGVGVIGS
jgi:hypothetical protein